jgi:ferric-dicitrate binding protein FerR (iron transport regulator)
MSEMNHHLTAQIVQLLKGNSSDQQAKAILDLEQEVWDAWFDDQEWERFSPGIIPGAWSDQWYQNIQAKKTSLERKMKWMLWGSVAAACMITVGIFFWMKSSGQKDVASIREQPQNIIKAPGQVTIENTDQQFKTCNLPDGSTVELSADSKISFADPMEQHKRSVWLEGEGVFHVRKDPSRPFTVYTHSFATTALGTVFKVSSLKNQPETVRLISGRISVTNQKKNQVVYLVAGEQYSFEPQTQMLKKNRLASKITGSREPGTRKTELIDHEELRFTKTPISEVFKKIESVHHIHIIYSAAGSATTTFTGSFRINAPGEAIETIALLNDLEMKRVGDTVYLKKK